MKRLIIFFAVLFSITCKAQVSPYIISYDSLTNLQFNNNFIIGGVTHQMEGNAFQNLANLVDNNFVHNGDITPGKQYEVDTFSTWNGEDTVMFTTFSLPDTQENVRINMDIVATDSSGDTYTFTYRTLAANIVMSGRDTVMIDSLTGYLWENAAKVGIRSATADTNAAYTSQSIGANSEIYQYKGVILSTNNSLSFGIIGIDNPLDGDLPYRIRWTVNMEYIITEQK